MGGLRPAAKVQEDGEAIGLTPGEPVMDTRYDTTAMPCLASKKADVEMPAREGDDDFRRRFSIRGLAYRAGSGRLVRWLMSRSKIRPLNSQATSQPLPLMVSRVETTSANMKIPREPNSITHFENVGAVG